MVIRFCNIPREVFRGRGWPRRGIKIPWLPGTEIRVFDFLIPGFPVL